MKPFVKTNQIEQLRMFLQKVISSIIQVQKFRVFGLACSHTIWLGSPSVDNVT